MKKFKQLIESVEDLEGTASVGREFEKVLEKLRNHFDLDGSYTSADIQRAKQMVLHALHETGLSTEFKSNVMDEINKCQTVEEIVNHLHYHSDNELY